uniref:NADH dehydrogenase subunit 4L n=1 Tax=Pteria penguin TaxID=113549 RepID=A0A1P8CZ17_PTEPN|nr:NADH dehydrogenase subunit 4L [Pteria penguin]
MAILVLMAIDCYYLFLEKDSVIGSILMLEIMSLGQVMSYSCSTMGNCGFMYGMFCLLSVEVSVLASLFVANIRAGGDSRVSGKCSLLTKEIWWKQGGKEEEKEGVSKSGVSGGC